MPGKTIIEIPTDLQEKMLAELRQARVGYLLALHSLLLCAKGRTPTEIAAFLFCSRSSVYRAVAAYRRGEIPFGNTTAAEVEQPGIVRRSIPSLHRSLLSLLKCAPRAFGWCRTRWSCSSLAAELAARRGVAVSPEKIRRWLHDLG